MPDRQDRRELTKTGKGRRALIPGGIALGAGVLLGVTISKNFIDAYISDPADNAQTSGEGYTVSGRTTRLHGQSLWVAVNKLGRYDVWPQVGPVDPVNEIHHPIYHKWVRTGVSLKELGEYSILLYRLSGETAMRTFDNYMQQGLRTGNFEPLSVLQLRQNNGFILEDHKIVRRIA
jgi:hypothetical protein